MLVAEKVLLLLVISLTDDLSNTGLGNGLLPNDTKRWPKPMLTYHQQSPLAFQNNAYVNNQDINT